jgi:hypothetical protein
MPGSNSDRICILLPTTPPAGDGARHRNWRTRFSAPPVAGGRWHTAARSAVAAPRGPESCTNAANPPRSETITPSASSTCVCSSREERPMATPLVPLLSCQGGAHRTSHKAGRRRRPHTSPGRRRGSLLARHASAAWCGHHVPACSRSAGPRIHAQHVHVPRRVAHSSRVRVSDTLWRPLPQARREPPRPPRARAGHARGGVRTEREHGSGAAAGADSRRGAHFARVALARRTQCAPAAHTPTCRAPPRRPRRSPHLTRRAPHALDAKKTRQISGLSSKANPCPAWNGHGRIFCGPCSVAAVVWFFFLQFVRQNGLLWRRARSCEYRAGEGRVRWCGGGRRSRACACEKCAPLARAAQRAPLALYGARGSADPPPRACVRGSPCTRRGAPACSTEGTPCSVVVLMTRVVPAASPSPFSLSASGGACRGYPDWAVSPVLCCLLLNGIVFAVQRRMVAGAGGDAAIRAAGKKSKGIRSSAGTPCARACSGARAEPGVRVCGSRSLTAPLDAPGCHPRAGRASEFKTFQWQWLAVYLVVMLADWLQVALVCGRRPCSRAGCASPAAVKAVRPGRAGRWGGAD